MAPNHQPLKGSLVVMVAVVTVVIIVVDDDYTINIIIVVDENDNDDNNDNITNIIIFLSEKQLSGKSRLKHNIFCHIVSHHESDSPKWFM